MKVVRIDTPNGQYQLSLQKIDEKIAEYYAKINNFKKKQ